MMSFAAETGKTCSKVVKATTRYGEGWGTTISGAVQETTGFTRAQVMPPTTSWIAGVGTSLRVQDLMEGRVIYICTITVVLRQGRPSTWSLVRKGPRYAHA